MYILKSRFLILYYRKKTGCTVEYRIKNINIYVIVFVLSTPDYKYIVDGLCHVLVYVCILKYSLINN